MDAEDTDWMNVGYKSPEKECSVGLLLVNLLLEIAPEKLMVQAIKTIFL